MSEVLVSIVVQGNSHIRLYNFDLFLKHRGWIVSSEKACLIQSTEDPNMCFTPDYLKCEFKVLRHHNLYKLFSHSFNAQGL